MSDEELGLMTTESDVIVAVCDNIVLPDIWWALGLFVAFFLYMTWISMRSVRAGAASNAHGFVLSNFMLLGLFAALSAAVVLSGADWPEDGCFRHGVSLHSYLVGKLPNVAVYGTLIEQKIPGYQISAMEVLAKVQDRTAALIDFYRFSAGFLIAVIGYLTIRIAPYFKKANFDGLSELARAYFCVSLFALVASVFSLLLMIESIFRLYAIELIAFSNAIPTTFAVYAPHLDLVLHVFLACSTSIFVFSISGLSVPAKEKK